MGDYVLCSTPGAEHQSHYITSHPGQLSLAIPLWVVVMSNEYTILALIVNF